MSIFLIVTLIICICLISSYFSFLAKIYYFFQVKLFFIFRFFYSIIYGFWIKEWWQVRKQFTHPLRFYHRINFRRIAKNLIPKLKQLILSRFKKKKK